ncbi:MAG: hypothetical protein QM529_00085 [Hydrotalea sp.]|nr:hypothetical protein [Hydrotalea sp.]
MTKFLTEQFSLFGFIYGLVAWAVAFLAGGIYMRVMGIADKETALADNMLHIIAIIVLVIATTIFYLRLRAGGDFSASVANSFFVINLAMDFVVLILLMGFDFSKWAMVGIPAYLIIFYGLYALLKN